MGRKKNAVPSMILHRASGQARVCIDGKEYLLGPFGSDEAIRRYGEALAKHKAGLPPVGRNQVAEADPGFSVSELCLRFVNEALPKYSRAERLCQITAIRVLRQLFGLTSVKDFGPLKLRIVRDAMVAGDPSATDAEGNPKPRKPWSRQSVNRQIKRIQSLFRWGVSWEIVPESVARSIATVSILKAGETSAAESTPRRSVSQADIEAVRKILKPLYQDILDLLNLTGARPGELIELRGEDINQTEATWRADLTKHKTAHKGKRRTLFFNQTAQAILLRNFKGDPEAKIFPCRRDNFSTAINRACKKAGIVPFVAHELRHTVAHRLVDSVGLESAQRLLGHSDAAMTEHYSRTADKQAIDAANSLG